jgi:hypothetical protein
MRWSDRGGLPVEPPNRTDHPAVRPLCAVHATDGPRTLQPVHEPSCSEPNSAAARLRSQLRTLQIVGNHR